jgi:hypothetical protein
MIRQDHDGQCPILIANALFDETPNNHTRGRVCSPDADANGLAECYATRKILYLLMLKTRKSLSRMP